MYNAFLSNVSLYYASLFYVVEVHLWIWHPNTNNNEYRWIWQTTTNNNQWWILAKWKNCLLAGGISTLQHRKLLCRRAALASNTEIITTGDISTRQHKKHMCRRVLYAAYQQKGLYASGQAPASTELFLLAQNCLRLLHQPTKTGFSHQQKSFLR
jgi:hypothetical protein